MRSVVLSSLLALPLIACTPAEDAPEDVGEGATYALADIPAVLFTNFDGGDDALVTTALEDLKAEILAADLSVSAKDRSYTLPVLTESEMGGATFPAGADPAAQIATVLLGESRHTVALNAELAVEPNQVCIESNTTVYVARTFLSDETCFVGMGCDVLRTSNEVRKENFLAKAWYTQLKDFRWFEMADGSPAIVARSWTPRKYPGDNGNTEFAQSFTVEVWIPHGEATLRAYAMWAEINIGIGPDGMQTLIIEGLNESMGFGDSFLDRAGYDYCPNDRDLPRPEGGPPPVE